MYNARLICEGPTDIEVFRAILRARLGANIDYNLDVLQPQMSAYGGAGPLGGGWKGVRAWCQSLAAAGGLEALCALTEDVDVLVIHVDAGIAADPEIEVARPCPPPMDTVEGLRRVLASWLSIETLPAKLALWVPAMATEAWILRAFFPTDPRAAPCGATSPTLPCVECLDDPARALIHREPRFVRMKAGVVKKLRQTYRAEADAFAQRWPEVVETCEAAKCFDLQLRVTIS